MPTCWHDNTLINTILLRSCSCWYWWLLQIVLHCSSQKMVIVYNFVAKLELATCTFVSYPTPSLPKPTPVEIVFRMVFLHLILEVIPFCSGQTLISTQPPPSNFDSSVVFEVLRVTDHHAKFLCKLAAGKLCTSLANVLSSNLWFQVHVCLSFITWRSSDQMFKSYNSNVNDSYSSNRLTKSAYFLPPKSNS